MTTLPRLRLRVTPLGLLAAAVLVVAGSQVAARLSGPAATGPAPALAGGGTALADAPLAPDLGTIDKHIAIWSRKAAANDDDYISATNLGVLFLGRARLSGDLGDYTAAAAAAERALIADPGYVPARALDVVVRFSVHDFTGALSAAQALVADDPGQLDALGVVADASLELGDLEAARRTYERLASLAPGPGLDARMARLAYLSGDPDGALDRALRARDRTITDEIGDPVFFHFQLGEIARMTGDAKLARQAFESALSLRLMDRAALLGLAKLDAAEGNVQAAIAGLRTAAAIAPEPPTLALLGDLLALDGQAAAADDQYAIVRFTRELSQIAGQVYDRQLILFELDHGGATPQLLEQAIAAAAVRADAPGIDILAWAYHRLGRDQEARAASERARGTGIRDARIDFHAGAIALVLGDRATGEALLADALALGPALDPVERAEAERLLGS